MKASTTNSDIEGEMILCDVHGEWSNGGGVIISTTTIISYPTIDLPFKQQIPRGGCEYKESWGVK